MRHTRLIVAIPLLALGVYGLSGTTASAGPRPPKHVPPTTKPVPTKPPHPTPPTTKPATPPPPHPPTTKPATPPPHPHLPPPPMDDDDDQVSR